MPVTRIGGLDKCPAHRLVSLDIKEDNKENNNLLLMTWTCSRETRLIDRNTKVHENTMGSRCSDCSASSVSVRTSSEARFSLQTSSLPLLLRRKEKSCDWPHSGEEPTLPSGISSSILAQRWNEGERWRLNANVKVPAECQLVLNLKKINCGQTQVRCTITLKKHTSCYR